MTHSPLAAEAATATAQSLATAVDVPLSVYGAIAFTYILSKLVLSTRYSPSTAPLDELDRTVSVVIPEYNEDPDLFRRALESVLLQEHALEEIWIVDDGSDDTRAWEIAEEFAARHDVVRAHRLPENRGKRHAQAFAFRRATGDVFVTMDSDTVLEADAVGELLRPLFDEDVVASTGYPKIVDRDEGGLLRRIIDMRYFVAFNVERAAQSTFGTVSCCCGVLSAYDAGVVREHLEEYVSQTFLGRECTFGDDRRLTAHSLQHGDVVYQSTAVAYTDAPTSLREYITQQVRWMRSFWRESVLALRWAPRRSVPLTAMLCVDLALPFLLLGVGIGGTASRATEAGVPIVAGYVAVVAVVAYVRNLAYVRERLDVYLLSPVYGLLYLLVMLPLSMYALATVRASGWGTR